MELSDYLPMFVAESREHQDGNGDEPEDVDTSDEKQQLDVARHSESLAR